MYSQHFGWGEGEEDLKTPNIISLAPGYSPRMLLLIKPYLYLS